MDFVFKTEWMSAISKLKPEQQAEAYSAIQTIVEEQTMPTDLSFEVDFLLTAIYSQIVDGMNNTNRRGAPKGNRNASQKQPENNSETIKKQKNQLNSIEKQIKTNKTIDLNCFSEKEKAPSSPTPPLTEKEKDKENYNYVVVKENEKTTSPSSSSLFSVSEIEDVLMGQEQWVDAMRYKYKLDKEQLAVQIHCFCRGWVERGDDVKTLKDAKRHADSLLNIKQQNGELTAAPAWNQFLAGLMEKHLAELGYDWAMVTAFGRHYMQDVGNGKPFFVGIPHFEEEIFERMRNFKENYKPPEYEQLDEPGSRSQSA